MANETLARVWRGYALDTLPQTHLARMVYRELEIEIVRLERLKERTQVDPADLPNVTITFTDPDDDYVPNLNNAALDV